MPPTLLYDLSKVDFRKIVVSQEGIRAIIPQRFEMEMLTGIVHEDDTEDVIIGVKDVRADEFWVRGHIPGRPLFPGVLMIETAAQLCAYWTMKRRPQMGFIGFAKCDEVRFRAPVIPPAKLFIVVKTIELNNRRAVGKCQGILNGNMVFEATITGMSV